VPSWHNSVNSFFTFFLFDTGDIRAFFNLLADGFSTKGSDGDSGHVLRERELDCFRTIHG